MTVIKVVIKTEYTISGISVNNQTCNYKYNAKTRGGHDQFRISSHTMKCSHLEQGQIQDFHLGGGQSNL